MARFFYCRAIDLVFYNFLLRCSVLVDLKIGELTHQDIGQMDGYVRVYKERHLQKELLRERALIENRMGAQP